jgi:FAD/FMN-containing dehydrogenase/Fe-S oxidoreductase
METSNLIRALQESVRGEVRFDPYSRTLYSTDASIYQILPIGVVIPRDEEDIAATLRIAHEQGVPVLPRGGGTSLAGQSIGRAIILDCSRYMDRLLDLDPAGRFARIQPGIIQDELNLAAHPHGLRLGPDTATSNRATLGGMMGNNSSGARSILYGKTSDHVQELRVQLIDGTELHLRRPTPQAAGTPLPTAGREAEIYEAAARLVDRHRVEIDRRFPKILRRVSGYNLDLLAADPTDLVGLLIGSEGTLGIITEARVGLVPKPAHAAVLVVHFADHLASFEAVPLILESKPSAVELIDRMVLEMTRAQLEYARRLTFVQGDPEALLIVELSGDDPAALRAGIADLETRLRAAGHGFAYIPALTAAEQDNIWRVRKAGQGLLQGIKGDAKPITFVEDTAVPAERLAAYMRRFRALLGARGVRAAFYAHASVGCIHVRPLINLKARQDIEMMKAIAREVGELVVEFGGTMSGEHGDGLVRSWFVERFFGPALYAAFREVKRAFDPPGLMNPGKIVDAPPIDEALRYGPAYRTLPVTTYFDWSRDGGFAAAVELCSGVGACRKKIEGTMCPSYMVTREEEHSTRGRANLLRAVLSGTLPPGDLTGRRLFDALDLCLECKGCKAECPANVDMAKLKYEFLAGYHRAHGIPLRDRAFGNFRALVRWGSAAAPLSTWLAETRPVRWAMDAFGGIDRRRPLPPLARQTFLQWWSGRSRDRRTPGDGAIPRDGEEWRADATRHGGVAPGNGGAPRGGEVPAPRGTVAFFADTFTIYNYPELGRAAVRLLERLGYEVVGADTGCCARTLISKGFLAQARRAARANVAALLPLAAAGTPIVGLEPSCILTFRDEIPDLVPGDEARMLARHMMLIDEFLAAEHARAPLPLGDAGGRRVLLHGHCHQKALAGTRTVREILRAGGYAVEEVDSGCCGMAGSFGFEREHYDLSLAIGERRLLPAVRALPRDVPVVAMGVSCRQQIAHGTGRSARHLVELLEDGLSSEHGT